MTLATGKISKRISLPYNGRITAGRAEDNDIRILYPFMSRHHFRILMENGTVHVEDLKSTNGLCLNGKPITKAIMKSGDVLTGSRAVVHAKMNPEKKLYSVPAFIFVSVECYTNRSKRCDI